MAGDYFEPCSLSGLPMPPDRSPAGIRSLAFEPPTLVNPLMNPEIMNPQIPSIQVRAFDRFRAPKPNERSREKLDTRTASLRPFRAIPLHTV